MSKKLIEGILKKQVEKGGESLAKVLESIHGYLELQLAEMIMIRLLLEHMVDSDAVEDIKGKATREFQELS